MRIQFAFLAASALAFGQGTASPATPDGAALLAGSEAVLQQHHSYQFSEDISVQIKMPGPPQGPMEFTGTVQAVNPDRANPAGAIKGLGANKGNKGKMRLEVKAGGADGILVISDGSTTWMYMPLFQQFTRTPQQSEGLQNLTDMIGLAGMPDVAKETGNAKVIRSEQIDIDGEPHDCWVVQNRMDKFPLPAQPGAEILDPLFTYWIDKTLGFAVKTSMSMKVQTAAGGPLVESLMETLTHSIKFDPDLPDSLFVFTPPPGATETAELFPGMRRILGGRVPAVVPPSPAPPQ